MLAARFFRLAVAVTPVLLVGCAAVPALGPAPQPRAAPSYAAGRSLAAVRSGEWPGDRWWTAYGDPQLDQLIGEALAGSPDLVAAAARVRAAEAIRQQTGAALLPSVDAQGSVAAVKQSYNNGIPPAFVPRGINYSGQAALNLGFDPDLWGRNRASLAAATSDAEAAGLEQAEAALSLSTNIAAAYGDLVRLGGERRVQEEALRVRQDTARLVRARVSGGLDTQAESRQAAAAVPATRANLTATEEQIGLTRNRIAALLGQGPDRGSAIKVPSAAVRSREVPPDVTTNLIGRRPDVAAARARVEAAASRIRVARADFYPSLNLSALVGFQSLGLSKLFNGSSSFLNAGPAVSLPVFRGGQLRGRYRETRAGYDEAVAQYDRVVTDAFRDVADAVTSGRSLERQLADARQALVESEAAFSLVRLRYTGGLSTFLDVLTAEDRLVEARRSVAGLEARSFAIDVSLVRALGGGFVQPAGAINQAQKENGRG